MIKNQQFKKFKTYDYFKDNKNKKNFQLNKRKKKNKGIDSEKLKIRIYY